LERKLIIQVNNEAIADYGNSYEEQKPVLQTNYWGVKNVTRGLLPLLGPSSSGARIINVSSHFGMLERIKDATHVQQLSDIGNLSEEKIDAFVQQFIEDSNSGDSASGGGPKNRSTYCVSKVALNAYTRVLAKELPNRHEGLNFYVNSMTPGYV
jgi:carbonyl reductase 1